MQLLFLAVLAVALLGPRHVAARQRVVLDDDEDDEDAISVPQPAGSCAGQLICEMRGWKSPNGRWHWHDTKIKTHEYVGHACTGINADWAGFVVS